ncbi:coiled-coil domain-containing protein [Mesorhizobium xinjiangense]|uniref:hypothetical protein n=1 Tax=Mesorhizobium xinjiangense TaxID=2678685 RepID=UPI0012EE5BB4|nr:hypothetical protein [Mesorhizobium xinjiangense]
MTEFVLIFLLGFCCAAFLALLAAPSVWRRAVSLTTERIEATVPLTVGEFKAENDRQRAEHAMEVRRIEIALKAEREKVARQEAEIARQHEAIRHLTEDLEGATAQADTRQSADLHLGGALDAGEEEVGHLAHRLKQAETVLHERETEVDRLTRMLEEASLDSSNRQIDLAARESEIASLHSELAGLRAKGQEMEHDGAEATVADPEAKMDGNDREAAERRETSASPDAGEKNRPNGSGDLEERLAEVLKAKERLQQELAALGAQPSMDNASRQAEEAELRDRIGGVAAEILHLAVTLDGADSPIHDLLEQEPGPESGKGRSQVPSLAERVRALS